MEFQYEDECDEVPNLCISCGVDLGPGNPRQYCRKTWCPKEVDSDDEVPDIKKRKIDEEKTKLDIVNIIFEKSKKIKELKSDIDQLEKDLIALKETLDKCN